MVLTPSLDDAFAPAEPGPSQRPAGWLISLALHGLAAFFLIHQLNMLPTTAVSIVPVEMVQLAEETVAPAPPPASRVASPPQRTVSAQPRPPAAPVQAAPVIPAIPNPSAETAKEPLRQDELETKLAALAKLRQPETGVIGGTGTAAFGGGKGPGAGSIAVKDLIRAQVERRWSLDTETLNGRNVTVSIRVVLDRDGAVTRVEIIDNARYESDALYHDIAVRARNAVLLSSPFSLPQGHDEVTDVTLVLNPRDTFR